MVIVYVLRKIEQSLIVLKASILEKLVSFCVYINVTSIHTVKLSRVMWRRSHVRGIRVKEKVNKEHKKSEKGDKTVLIRCTVNAPVNDFLVEQQHTDYNAYKVGLPFVV